MLHQRQCERKRAGIEREIRPHIKCKSCSRKKRRHERKKSIEIKLCFHNNKDSRKKQKKSDLIYDTNWIGYLTLHTYILWCIQHNTIFRQKSVVQFIWYKTHWKASHVYFVYTRRHDTRTSLLRYGCKHTYNTHTTNVPSEWNRH